MNSIAHRITATGIAAALSLSPITLTGCESLPGSPETQGAVGGGAAGAAAGALIGGEDNRLVGALIGGAAGAAGGYLIGANKDKLFGDDESSDEAVQAVQDAQADPATASEARYAETADIDNDGFVTLDEVIALEQAGLSDDQIVDRLRATDQVFDVSQAQADRLLAAGVSQNVIQRMQTINQDVRDDYLRSRNVLTDTSASY